MLNNNIISFTSNNPIDKIFDENEDALRIESKHDDSQKLIAISDGAGGVGIYCKQWAEFLVKNAPIEIPSEGINSWFLETSKKFYFQNSKIDFLDVETKEKFISSGSYATLLLLWLDNKNHILNYVGVGDSSLFIFRKDKKGQYHPIIIYPINNNEFIDQNPILLNWKKNSQFDSVKKIDIQRGDVIFAASDSISRWMLENLLIIQQADTLNLLKPNFIIDHESLENNKLNNCNFKKIEDIFEAIPKVDSEAINYFENLINNNCMEADDLTLYMEIIL